MPKSIKNDINEIILSTVQDAIVDTIKSHIQDCVCKYLTDAHKLIIDQAVRDVIEDIGLIPESAGRVKEDKKKKAAPAPLIVSDSLFREDGTEVTGADNSVEPVVGAVPEPAPATVDDIDMSDILDSITNDKGVI